MKTLLPIIFISLLILGSAIAQQSPDLGVAADTAYQNKNWTEAEKLYSELVQSHTAVGRYWYRLGVSQHNAGHNDKALQTLESAKAKGFPSFFIDYALADVYATTSQSDKAFAALAEAVKKGFAQTDQLNSDADLQSLRADARFAGVVEQTRKNQVPCEYSAENRQFDFWVGEWNVIPTSGGLPQGTSRIEKELGSCVIWEKWTSLGLGYAGKSYNVYNANLKRWEQFWVDNVGGMMHFYGGLKDGVMDYWTDDIPQPDGTKLRRHLQFFNEGPDKVRQLSQGSTDTGKTWHVEYDFTYLRKQPGSAKGK
jgi:tetratricopeptide (TPR) repeat protein